MARATQLAANGRGADGRESLSRNGRRSARNNARVAERAETIEAAPELGDALGSGDIGADQVDSVTRAAKTLPEDKRQALFGQGSELAEAASKMPADAFNTHCRNVARGLLDDEGEATLAKQKAATGFRKWIRKDGMHIVNGEFDPETGAALFAGVDAEVATLAAQTKAPKNDHTAAHALAGLVSRGLGAGPNTTTAEVVLIDVETLESGLHPNSICETASGQPLPPETVRRIGCDAVYMPTRVTTKGVALKLGRQYRTANRAQRRALRAMYPTCAWHGCDRQFDWCQIHHIVPWEQGGVTDLDNLVPLCAKHHHLVHEGAWSIKLNTDRTLAIRQPDGRHYRDVPLPSAVYASAAACQRRDERDRARTRLRESLEKRKPVAA